MPSLTPDGRRKNGKGSKWITQKRRTAITVYRDKLVCAYCAKDLHGTLPRNVHLDHLDPKVNGANHASDNLITACGRCNSRRQHKPLRAFVEMLVRENWTAESGIPADALNPGQVSREVTRRVRRIRAQARRSMTRPLAQAAELLARPANVQTGA